MDYETNVTPVDTSHRLLNILSHGAWFLGAPILIPLIIYLVTKRDGNIVTAHSAEAFNFHLSFTLWALLCIPLTFIGIGFLLIGALTIATVVLAIIAIIKAANDELYRYPLTIRFFDV
ncbi:DUF4870 domain-containing protein [Synoicihabitans lomoniglobus]|uniref:DUF4870 domain-containing protein n=1 Tax=Synoicihabitans lomoniglobus TaxID=2909285 RepID=A0AAF0CQI8_9BACT|nr:DUF4870 domain-containing protein [Opitutaceae bacterium LMO-M01]WED66188.1 DUF4870 domain-containing protein [Opitutaceae bacterium LMO-M01]